MTTSGKADRARTWISRTLTLLLLSVPTLGAPSWAADTTPPSVGITQPAANSVVPAAGFNFKGTATDASGVSEVRIYVFDYGRSSYIVSNALASYVPSTRSWTFAVQASHLTPGLRARLYVRAIDAAGNASIWLFRDVTAGTLAPDATAPSTPVVTDNGAYTSGKLIINWTSNDPESGIQEYQYTIRQDSPSGAFIVNWTSADLMTSVTRTGLPLVQDAVYYAGVRARNAAGLWSAEGYSDGITMDAAAPQISAIGVTGITATGAAVNWTTDEPARCRVEHGVTTAYGQTTPLEASPVASHTATLSGLAEFTDYHFRVRCTDRAGNAGQSSDQTLRTAANAPLGADAYDVEGIVFASWWQDEYASADAQQSLLKLAKTGTDYVGLVGTWYMQATSNVLGQCSDQNPNTIDDEQSTATTITPHLDKTPSDEALRVAMRRGKALGRKVFLKLHVRVIINDDPMGDWRDCWAGNIAPSNLTAWFDSYVAFATHYARLAEQEGAELLAFGTEMKSMTDPSSQASEKAAGWTRVIDAVKANYTGQITYSANIPNEFAWITFWNRCDYLGIGPYFSLNPTVPSSPGLDAIVDGWQNSLDGGDLIERLGQWSAANSGKPVLFTEIGYNSVDTATFHPWKGTQSLPVNQALQKRAYDALLLRLQGQSWFAGVFWWDWLTDPDYGQRTSQEQKEYSPQNKPAEQSLKNFFLGIDPSLIASVKIVDGDGIEVPDGTQVLVGRHRNLYAAGYDSMGALLGFVPASWVSAGSGGTFRSNAVGYARVDASAEGTVQVSATADGRSDTVTLSLQIDALRVPSPQYATIEAAAAAAQSGDTILVESGTSVPALYREGEITLPTGVKLVSEGGAALTVIDAMGFSYGVRGGELIEGFTIRNANGPGIGRGEGGFNENTTNTVRHNIIEHNGRGIDFYRTGAVTIANNIIRNNIRNNAAVGSTITAPDAHGAGIRLEQSGAIVVNNVVVDNVSGGPGDNSQGGGMYVWSASEAVIRNNIVTGNRADLGGGIRTDGFPTIDYNDVWGNVGRSVSSNDYFGTTPGIGSISADPQFVSPSMMDYHLQAGSPCINTGHPDPVYNDANGTRNDMGAYGGPDGTW